MATDRQIEANRLNAQKSTGPKTPEGRAAVRLNGVKHGITAQTLILKGESESDFTSLLDSFEAEHEPSTPTEEALVLQLAMAAWRLRRLYHAEGAFHTHQMKVIADTEIGRTMDASGRLALVNHWSRDTMATFNRQESRLERSFYRALHELQRLRKLALVSAAPAPGRPDRQISDIPRPQAQARLQIIEIPPLIGTNPMRSEPESAIHLVPTTPNMQ